MSTILRSAVAAAIAGGIAWAVGALSREFVLTADEMEPWSICVASCAAAGFTVDRALSRVPARVTPVKRLAHNVLIGASFTAALFVIFDVAAHLFHGRSGLPTFAEWLGLAGSAAVLTAWWLSQRIDGRAARARAEAEREARSVEIRRQARATADALARREPGSHP